MCCAHAQTVNVTNERTTLQWEPSRDVVIAGSFIRDVDCACVGEGLPFRAYDI